MEEKIIAQLKDSAYVKNAIAETLAGKISDAAKIIAKTFREGGKLLIAGNGGSAADAQHIAGELVAGFKLKRKALPAMALTTNTSIITAIGNDSGFEQVFTRQLEAFANHPSDVFLAISTSGNSKNIIEAVEFAKGKKIKTIGLSGQNGKLKDLVDLAIPVPSEDTQRIQESHIIIGHVLCELVEEELFS